MAYAEDILDSILNKDTDGIEQSFSAFMAEKVMAVIGEKKAEMSRTLFQTEGTFPFKKKAVADDHDEDADDGKEPKDGDEDQDADKDSEKDDADDKDEESCDDTKDNHLFKVSKKTAAEKE